MKGNPGKIIPENIIQEIRKAENVVVVTHSNPDGDALGSLFGFAELLEITGKKVLRFLEEPVSYLYSFLPGCEMACTDVDELHRFIGSRQGSLLVAVLDCGSAERLGRHKELLLQYEMVVIDHHRTHSEFSSNSWIDAESSSTGEMIYELGRHLDARLNYQAAYNLYVAILTDTGCFRYESTSSRTMRIAGDLLDLGVRPEQVCRELFDNYTHERLKLMELVLSTIELRAANQIAFMHVSENMLNKSGATMHDVEGFIDFPRSLRSVKVAALLKEKGNGCIGVSLRAKGECDVSRIARLFNGGGHRNAAGFRCFGKTMKQVQQDVENAISTCL